MISVDVTKKTSERRRLGGVWAEEVYSNVREFVDESVEGRHVGR